MFTSSYRYHHQMPHAQQWRWSYRLPGSTTISRCGGGYRSKGDVTRRMVIFLMAILPSISQKPARLLFPSNSDELPPTALLWHSQTSASGKRRCNALHMLAILPDLLFPLHHFHFRYYWVAQRDAISPLVLHYIHTYEDDALRRGVGKLPIFDKESGRFTYYYL